MRLLRRPAACRTRGSARDRTPIAEVLQKAAAAQPACRVGDVGSRPGQGRAEVPLPVGRMSYYSEGTLSRLLDHPSALVRRAAVFALSLIGGMNVNSTLPPGSLDKDRQVRQMASEALSSVWFRGVDDSQVEKLQDALSKRNPRQALKGLNDLVSETQDYAEAYNQRAVLYFRGRRVPQGHSGLRKGAQTQPASFRRRRHGAMLRLPEKAAGRPAGLPQCVSYQPQPRRREKSDSVAGNRFWGDR